MNVDYRASRMYAVHAEPDAGPEKRSKDHRSSDPEECVRFETL